MHVDHDTRHDNRKRYGIDTRGSNIKIELGMNQCLKIMTLDMILCDGRVDKYLVILYEKKSGRY